MLSNEYKQFYDRLILHSQRFVEEHAKATGSFQRAMDSGSDVRFINDYRFYAFTKSTKSLIAIRALLEMGNYEDALILSRTIFECYLSERYFDDKYDAQTIKDMVVTPKAIADGFFVHRNGIVVRRDTKDTVEYNIKNPEMLCIGKDKSYFYNLYYFLCENAHCNFSQFGAFLNEKNECVLYTEENAAMAQFMGLFVFYKIFESVVLLESTRFKDPAEEQACSELLVELTTFLYNAMGDFCAQPDPFNDPAIKDAKKTFRAMMSSLSEQLGRVEKGFVAHLEKQYVETSLEKLLKPALLESETPSAFFEDVRSRKKLSPRYVELEKLIGVPQDPKYHPEGDVWTHTMMVLDRAAKYRSEVSDPYAFMLLALTHDLGKTTTTTEQDGRVHSIGHEIAGLPIAERFLTRITNSDRVKKYVLDMIPLHLKPILYAHDRSSEKATNKMFAEAPNARDLLLFAMCDKEFSPEDKAFLEERYEKFRSGQEN